MYEHKHHPLLPRRRFVARLLWHGLFAWLLLLLSLWAGMLGYRQFEGLNWADAFLNAAMLLGGMGPVDAPHTLGGKLFAGAYALYAGLVFLIAVGILFAPVLHRVLHIFHLESGRADASGG